jgi:hypothetical protein
MRRSRGLGDVYKRQVFICCSSKKVEALLVWETKLAMSSSGSEKAPKRLEFKKRLP